MDPRRRLWILWALSVIVLLCFSLALASTVQLFAGYYRDIELRELPKLTEIVLRVGPYYWAVTVPMALEGVRRLRLQDPWTPFGAWMLFVALFTGLTFAMAVSLAYPVWVILWILRK